jgi:hypothetical protein
MEPSQPVTPPDSRALCAALDKYRLPRAIVRVETRSFVAWNKPFLTLTGFSGDKLANLNAQDWVVLGDPVAEPWVKQKDSFKQRILAKQQSLQRSPASSTR